MAVNSFKRAILACAVLALAGCDSGTIRNPIPSTLKYISALLTPNAPAVDPREVLTLEQVEDAGAPILLIHAIDTTGAFILMDRVTSGRFTRWGALSGGEVIFDNQLPFRTHAFGPDLLSVDARETHQALADRETRQVKRVQTYLDGENEEIVVSFSCRVTPEGAGTITSLGRDIVTFVMREDCTSEELQVTNRYWLGANGQIVRQIVWINPDLMRLEFEFL